MPKEKIIHACRELRTQFGALESATRDLMNHEDLKEDQSFACQHQEMKANVMLAVRHLEDARMRLGKVIQWAEDGVSTFDRDLTKG